MAYTLNDAHEKKLLRQLFLISLLMLVGMTIYEVLKQVVAPDITIWASHIVTILFSTACATIASFFILRKQNRLNGKLATQNIESEHLRKELEKSVAQLKDSLAEVKTLYGLLPICASCKKIRDDKGYWNQIETYISNRSEVSFSHSLCPECAHKLYPNYGKKKENDT